MAKVTGPLMSIEASVTFADTMVYAKWKGINYSRQYAISGNLEPRPPQGDPCPGQHKNSPIRASTRNRATFFM